jgi:hypothetical protein
LDQAELAVIHFQRLTGLAHGVLCHLQHNSGRSRTCRLSLA